MVLRDRPLVLIITTLIASVATAPPTFSSSSSSSSPSLSSYSSVCNVRDYGARGDGTTLDTDAINAALGDLQCQTVLLDNGTFLCGSLHLRSNLELVVTPSAVLLGADNHIMAYDLPEPNPWDAYQDFGHSHWHDSLLWGDGVKNITIHGGGRIDGGGITSGDPPAGGGDKVIALRSSSQIVIRDLVLGNCTGHFAVLATNVENLLIENVQVFPTRDGLDIVSCRHVVIRNVLIVGGGDDACVLKSDFSVGEVLQSYNITVQDSSISTDGATALEIGSETVGDFYDIRFDNITVNSAGDAGIGIATMDGSNVHNVVYSNIVMDGVASPFQFYIGARLLRPPLPAATVGSISNIAAINITATNMFDIYKARNWTATLDGQPQDPEHNVSRDFLVGPNITFTNMQLIYRGGGLESDVAFDPQHIYDKWYNIGERPSYAWFMRLTTGVSMKNIEIGFDKVDGRPSFVIEVCFVFLSIVLIVVCLFILFEKRFFFC